VTPMMSALGMCLRPGREGGYIVTPRFAPVQAARSR
jgi:hypothetical protein